VVEKQKVPVSRRIQKGIFSSEVFFEGDINAGGIMLESRGKKDMFLVKTDPEGSTVWAKSFGGIQDDYISDMSIYNDNLIVAGSFADTIYFSENEYVADEFGDMFIGGFNTDGELISFHREGGIGGIHLNELEIDATGNYYLTGRFNGELNIGEEQLIGSSWLDISPWTGDSTVRYNENMFLIKYDPLLEAEWIKHYAQGIRSDWEEGLAIEVDENENVYFTCFNRDQPIDIEGQQINEWLFLTKLDPDGKLEWFVEAGPTRNIIRPQSLFLDSGSIYVGGQVSGNDSYIEDQKIVDKAWGDGFLSRFDTSGNLQWFSQIGEGSWRDNIGPNENMINVIKMFRDTIMVGGYFMGIVEDADANIHLVGGYDVFVAKFSKEGRILDAGQRVVTSWSAVNDLLVDDRGIFLTGFSFEGNQNSNMPSYLIAGKLDLRNGSLGVEDQIINKQEGIRIFPNPVSGQKIFIDNSPGEIMDIELCDSQGRKVGLNLTGRPTREIDLPELKPGIYYLSISSNGEKVFKRLIKL